ncbi:hypothetical protein AWB82_05921 [Caballeronia glebae]|uniref:Uncharacterized protein n=1 Tax=Caballeronia glebae TaxID=1777143 RepID=A0A158CWL3_9BURK|nr:hypothetical protein [Caballeronia glebae]SAK86782.1 hypothetical protein AWB82_05921 [Caballeronia glebae]
MKVIATRSCNLEMTLSVRADLQAQAEMMTFLVISHLATKFATGGWMSVENAVESSIYWSKSMQRDEDIVRRVMLGNRALSIAEAIEVETGLTLNGSALASIFDSNLRLDFSSVVTRDIYDRCYAYLLTVKQVRDATPNTSRHHGGNSEARCAKNPAAHKL